MINQFTKIQLNLLNKARQIKDKAIEPLIMILPAWLKPSYFTTLRLVILVIALILYFLNSITQSTFLILIIISVITDLIDGALARKRQTVSTFGATYDLLVDRLMFASIFFLIFKLNQGTGWLFQGLIDLLTMPIIITLYLLNKEGLIKRILTWRWLVFLIWLICFFISLILKIT